MAKFNSVRIYIVLIAKYGWAIFRFDVKNVFWLGELEDDVYMSIPHGYQVSNHHNIVYKFKKAVYKLK